jgi:uncharacterized membrane protein YoaK (UPF0700 family)
MDRAFPIPMFVPGVAAGAALNEAASRRGVRSLFSLLDRVSLIACIWLAFATGAVFGGYAQLRWGARSLFLPLSSISGKMSPQAVTSVGR